MRIHPLGRILFAAGFSGLGFLSLLFRDFALSYQPVPAWVPGRPLLGSLSGLILLAGGIGLLVRRTAVLSALALTAFVAGWQVLLHAPPALANAGHVGSWLGFSENVMLVAGGWILFLTLREAGGQSQGISASGAAGHRLGQTLFALSLPVIGLAHFVYADVTASMVPGWLPFHLGFAYLTGAGHLAAALGILLGVCRRLAAVLEATMISLIALLLHAPGVAAEPGSRSQWTMFFAVVAFAGAAWSVAGSFAEERSAPVPDPA